MSREAGRIVSMISVWDDKLYYLKNTGRCPGSSQNGKAASVWRKSPSWAQSGVREGTSCSTAEWPEGSSETAGSVTVIQETSLFYQPCWGWNSGLMHSGQTLRLSSYLQSKGPDFKRSILSQSKESGLASGLESNLG